MIRLKLFSDEVSLVISTLADGNMRAFSNAEFDSVLADQTKLVAELGAAPEKTARVLTTYNNRKCFTEYYAVDDDSIFEHAITAPEAELKLADGLATNNKDLALLLPLADCLGIIVYDQEHQIIGLLHSGRQNLEEDGAFKFIRFLQNRFDIDPRNVKVYFSPHAQNFEIFALNNAKLAEAAEEQLVRAGVDAKNIERSDIDTVTDSDFPSNSAGDKTTRFAVAVKMN